MENGHNRPMKKRRPMTKNEARRRQQRRKIRRRRLMLRRLQFGVGCILLLALIIFLLIKAVGCGKSLLSNKKPDINVVAQSDVEANNFPTQEIQTKPRIVVKYPTKSPDYVELTSDKIKSAYITLLDVDNNQIIAGRDSDRKIYPASMTKVMTLIVAVEHLKSLDQTFEMTLDITDPLYRENASVAGFEPGEIINAKDLLYGLILPSGADAAQALAIMIAGSEQQYANLMNEKCKEMGLNNTHFANTSGLHDENQYTTLTEMAMIMEYAMKDETCAKVLSTYQYTTASTPQHPEGILLTSTMFSRMYGNEAEGVEITAGKTGYTIEAGNCLVSYAVKNGHAYILVTAQGTNKWHSIFDDIEIYGHYLP